MALDKQYKLEALKKQIEYLDFSIETLKQSPPEVAAEGVKKTKEFKDTLLKQYNQILEEIEAERLAKEQEEKESEEQND